MQLKTLILLVFSTFSILPALAQSAPPAKAVSRWPDGTGDPDGTTCRPPRPLPNSRFDGPEVCKLNSEWALLRKTGQDISDDGKQIIPDPRGHNITPMNCSAVTTGASSAGGGAMVCR